MGVPLCLSNAKYSLAQSWPLTGNTLALMECQYITRTQPVLSQYWFGNTDIELVFLCSLAYSRGGRVARQVTPPSCLTLDLMFSHAHCFWDSTTSGTRLQHPEAWLLQQTSTDGPHLEHLSQHCVRHQCYVTIVTLNANLGDVT